MLYSTLSFYFLLFMPLFSERLRPFCSAMVLWNQDGSTSYKCYINKHIRLSTYVEVHLVKCDLVSQHYFHQRKCRRYHGHCLPGRWPGSRSIVAQIGLTVANRSRIAEVGARRTTFPGKQGHASSNRGGLTYHRSATVKAFPVFVET